MGVDPLTLGVIASAGASIYGAHNQASANKQNYNAQQQAAQYQMQQQGLINSLAQGQFQQGQNPFSQMLLNAIGGQGGGGGQPQYSEAGIMPWSGGMVNQMAGGTPSLSGLASGRFSLNQPQSGLMFTQPQNLPAFTYSSAGYNPSTYGASTIGTVPQIGAPTVGAGQIQSSLVNAPFLNLSQLPQVNPQMVNMGAAGSQGFNTGQDALSQMLNRGPADQSQLIDALQPLDQRLIDQQVAGLQGSFGSLGERFGTAAADKQVQLRTNFAQNIGARNAQLLQTAQENNAQRQLAAAQGLQQGGLQQSGLLSQIALANQQAGIQAGGMNQDAVIRALLANQGVGIQAGLANQQNIFGTQQANVASQLQAALANQSTGLAASQGNASNALQALLANMSSLNQAGQFNAGAFNTAGAFNATGQNQAGQFNAGQQAQTSQYNAAQQQQYNQFIQSIIGQAAGLQSGQGAQNAQLLAIMAGLPGIGAPQVQPSPYPGAIGDISQLAMFYPLLQGLMGNRQPPINIPNFTPPPLPANFPTYSYPP